ncbi:M48 family metallopeptidase [Deferribacterales bacterium Es71-Z0220]|uniref:M48 family metallopeptidase n=1 Tax=Deferrivibrio essentukiensis TaxID=2880922 RepID=UPI001F603391|nr:SprT family zinc-dependent metalloprotease [Deferrivibrio essentukiensis]MCB4205492.1 M48 family metallopeptidase [Deferrivibrio essentukiensis]
MEQININGIKIDVIRKNIKNINLAVYPLTGRVRVSVPTNLNEDAIRVFILSKLAWIKRNQKKFIEQERIAPREYKQGESHYFQGKQYLLKIIKIDKKPKVVLKNKEYIELHIKPNTPIAERHKLLTEWYREQLKKQIPTIIYKWEKILNVKVSEFKIRQMKTRWGSCNIRKKRIWLNLELAKKTERCLEYVIVHEMVHLLERFHNKRFYHYMDTFLPNWKQLKNELNKVPISCLEYKY